MITSDGRIGASISRIANVPASSATRSRSACTAGIEAVPVGIIPSVSARHAMVEAVPITPQVPAVMASRPSISPIRSARDGAGAILRPVAPAIGAGGQPLALVRRGQHRPGHQLDRRNVRRRRGHQLRRHRLVAAAHQHHRVHRLRRQHRLGVERGEVPVMHRTRMQRRLAQRHRGERHRQPAGGQHAALHRLDQVRHRAVAVVVGRAGVDDADHRAIQHRLRIPHRLGEGAAEIQRELAVAVVGRVAREAAPGTGMGHGAHARAGSHRREPRTPLPLFAGLGREADRRRSRSDPGEGCATAPRL